jgi:hypothetical protein
VSDWKEKRARRHIVTSASQFETFTMCPRKWWFDKVRRLKTPTKGSFTFGTVLHACIERWMLADDNGRDESGEPVDIYPEGWQFDDDGERITKDEESIVRRLIDKALENGVLQRLPDRTVEHEFRRPILESSNGTNVEIMGFVDVLYPDRIEDHKSTKSMRWAKSEKSLRTNLQLLVYAKEALIRAGDNPPDRVLLRHNYFCKDPKDLRVRSVEVLVTRQEIEDHWQTILEKAERMTQIRDSAEHWDDIPDPENPSQACNAYGGCPFLSICSRKESVKEYEDRLDFAAKLSQNVALTSSVVQTNGGSSMSTFREKLAAKKNKLGPTAAAAAVAEPASATEPEVVEVEPEVAKISPKHDTAPPWANPECPACGGRGFNSKGQPCRICDAKAKGAGRPTSSEYEIYVDDEGNLCWKLPGADIDQTEGSAPAPSGGTEVKAEARSNLSSPEPDDLPRPDPVVARANAQIAEDISQAGILESLKAKKPGRPKKGFLLAVNCTPTGTIGQPGSGRHVHRLDRILDRMMTRMAKDAGVPSFYDLDVWDRRNKIAAAAPLLAEQFGADIVVAHGLGSGASELRTLVDALRPCAGMEFVACSG